MSSWSCLQCASWQHYDCAKYSCNGDNIVVHGVELVAYRLCKPWATLHYIDEVHCCYVGHATDARVVETQVG